MTLQTVIDLLDHALQKDKISADVYGRRKEPYSIYRKMVSLDLDFEAIYDIVGVRILVDTVEECYLADLAVDKLGDKVKYDDYIERPRGPLGYQSLHRVLQDVTGGTLIEVQIRTREMHERAERGSAAHWIYKLGGMTPDDAMIKKISELRERLEALRNTLSDLGDAPEGISLDEFVDTIRDNALGPRIHVLTPQGHLISLPKGATPIDFAYHIHTDLGHECFGAKVDDKSVRLDHELEDGNKVEIIRRKGSSPKLYWLSEGKVKSSRAKQKIRQYFKQQGRPKAISFGRNIVQKRLAAVRTYSVQVEDVVKIFSQSHTLGISSDEDLYLAVAEDRISADRLTRTIGEWLVERALTGVSLPRQAVSELATVCSEAKLITLPRHERLFVAVGDGSITADTLDRAVRSLADRGSEPSQISAGVPAISSRTATSGLLNRPAQCCYPLPGDPIVGYVTLGRGLAIHRAICPNALVSERQGRIIPIEWRDLELDEGQTFSGELFLVMSKADSKTYQAIQDKVQRLKGVMRVLTSPMGTSNRVVSQVRLIVDVKSISHLRNIERSLQQIPDVINVRRSHEE